MKGGIALAALGIVLALSAAMLVSISLGGRDQPIAFNHRLHVEDAGAECADCHLYVLTGARATIPNVEVCAGCHSDALTDSVEEARLMEYVEKGEPIPWRKIYSVEDHVFFSHRRHAALGEVPCEDCHGRVGERTDPVVRRAVEISMERCMNCHDKTGVSNDCLLCHR